LRLSNSNKDYDDDDDDDDDDAVNGVFAKNGRLASERERGDL